MNKQLSTTTIVSKQVLNIIKNKFMKYDNTPFCFVQTSHRSKQYDNLNVAVVDALKNYFNASEYEILLMPSGSAMSSVFYNIVQNNTNIVFYSLGQFGDRYYHEMKKYHKETVKVTNTQQVESLVENSHQQCKSLIHYNKIESGYETTLPPFTQEQRKNVIIIKNINYCFPWEQTEPLNQDIVYFDTDTGFSVPGFTVIMINKKLMQNIEVKSDIPDMLDFHQMIKMKSVVNTPFTLCTLVLYENIMYASHNKQKLKQIVIRTKNNKKRKLQQLGLGKLKNPEQRTPCKNRQCMNFITFPYNEQQLKLVNSENGCYGWVDKKQGIVTFFIQAQQQLQQ